MKIGGLDSTRHKVPGFSINKLQNNGAVSHGLSSRYITLSHILERLYRLITFELRPF